MLVLPYSCNDPEASVDEQAAFPVVNIVLTALFVAVFLLLTFHFTWGHAVLGPIVIPLGWTAHLNIYHLIGNLLLLHAFGNFANRRMGSWAYSGFVVVSGIGGAVTHELLMGQPVIGASAIIFASLGYALVVEPVMPVGCTYWIVVRWGCTRLPLAVVAAVLLVDHLVIAVAQVETGVSHPAHAFGLLWGLLVGLVARIRRQ